MYSIFLIKCDQLISRPSFQHVLFCIKWLCHPVIILLITLCNDHGTANFTHEPSTVNGWAAATELWLSSILLAAECDPEHLFSSLLDHAHAVVVQIEWVPVKDMFWASDVTLQHVVVEFILLWDEYFRFNLGVIDVSYSCFGVYDFHEMGLVTRDIIAVWESIQQGL